MVGRTLFGPAQTVPTTGDLLEELNFLSDKLSDRSRVIAVGVIATWWATLVGDKAPPGLDEKALLGPVICAAISFLLDVMQYVAGYRQCVEALATIEQKKLTEFQYDKDSPFFRGRKALFITKQIAAIVAIVWLIVILLRKYWS